MSNAARRSSRLVLPSDTAIRPHRRLPGRRTLLALGLAGVILGSAAIVTDTFGAGYAFQRLVARVELVLNPPPDRVTRPTVVAAPRAPQTGLGGVAAAAESDDPPPSAAQASLSTPSSPPASPPRPNRARRPLSVRQPRHPARQRPAPPLRNPPHRPPRPLPPRRRPRSRLR